MVKSHPSARAKLRLSRIDQVLILISSFLLGSLLTSEQVCLVVARYLTATSPLTPTDFTFLDDLAIYSLISGIGLCILIALGLIRMIMWYFQLQREHQYQ